MDASTSNIVFIENVRLERQLFLTCSIRWKKLTHHHDVTTFIKELQWNLHRKSKTRESIIYNLPLSAKKVDTPWWRHIYNFYLWTPMDSNYSRFYQLPVLPRSLETTLLVFIVTTQWNPMAVHKRDKKGWSVERANKKRLVRWCFVMFRWQQSPETGRKCFCVRLT